MGSEALKKIDALADELLRGTLKELYEQCTSEQQVFFCRMYKSLEEIPEEKVRWAIQQCENTIRKNKREKENVK